MTACWFSPFADSSRLISTQEETRPDVAEQNQTSAVKTPPPYLQRTPRTRQCGAATGCTGAVGRTWCTSAVAAGWPEVASGKHGTRRVRAERVCVRHHVKHLGV